MSNIKYKIVTILLFFFCQISLFGQQDYEFVIDSIGFFSWNHFSDSWYINENITSHKLFYNTDGSIKRKIGYSQTKQNTQINLNWKEDYTYDKDMHPTEIIGYTRDPQNTRWVKSHRDIKIYDANGNILQTIRYVLDETSDNWIPYNRTISEYNEMGNEKEKTWEIWDKITNNWLQINGKTTTYSDNDEIIIEILCDWSSSTKSWKNNWKIISSSEMNNSKIQRTSYKWDTDAQDWILYANKASIYDLNGKLREHTVHNWDEAGGEWIGNFREVFLFDTIRNSVEHYWYEWDKINSYWSRYWCDVTRTYPAKSLIEQIMYSWEPAPNNWMNAVVSFTPNGDWIGVRQETEMYDHEIDAGYWRPQKKKTQWLKRKYDMVSIQDTAFLYALIEEGVDKNSDSLINYLEAESIITLDISGEIISNGLGYEVNSRGIKSLSGIEAFINLDYLNFAGNDIAEVDLSSNSELGYLNCSNNQLKQFKISKNTKLTYLDCSHNYIDTLFLTSNNSIRDLLCNGNQLTSLDISNNAHIINLDISNMPTLKDVCVWVLPFPPIDVSINSKGSQNISFTTDCISNDFGAKENEIVIYPNPVTDILHVQTPKSDQVSIEIFTTNGLVRKKDIKYGSSFTMDISSLENGLYFITIRSDSFVVTNKIIKQ